MLISLSKKIQFDTLDPQQHKQLLQKIKKLKQLELDAIKTQIEEEKVVSSADLEIYTAVTGEPCPRGDFQYRHFKPGAQENNQSVYTFIQNRFVVLPAVVKEEYYPFALIDKLLYEHHRNLWTKEPCVSIRRAIEKFIPKSFRESKAYFRAVLDKKEEEEGTHFGGYLSDDSDSEAEEEFSKLSADQKKHKNSKATLWRKRANYDKYVSSLKLFGDPPKPDLKKRPLILRDSKFKRIQVKNDLELLNTTIKNGDFTPEFLDTLDTKFMVAQYRGIHYFLTNFDKTTRKEHRDLDEIGKSQVSSSVLHQAGIKSYRDYLTKLNEDPDFQEKLIEFGKQVQALLLEMQETDPVSYNGYVYVNLFYLYQNWYSSNYDGLPDKLASDLANKNSHFKDFIMNSYRALLSTSDVPYHALKYSYGLKIYEGHKEERIRPQWREGGQAERPYSGKVYVSLHPITDYIQQKPSHLTSLFKDGLCQLLSNIAVERETSFLGYLPEDRVVYQMIAKYPSFKQNYKEIYDYKYGITKALFIQIRNALRKHPPHSDKRKALKRTLGEYLCAYHEVRLIDKANKKAKQKNAVLIYRDENGEFALHHPDTPTTANKRLNKIISTKRELYKALAPNQAKVIKKIDRAEFDKGVEKIEFIQENLDALRELVTLDELKALPLKTLKEINYDPLIELLVDKDIDWDTLINLPYFRLTAITQVEIIDLVVDDPDLFNVLREFSDPKLALLENERLLELLTDRKVTIDELNDIDAVDLVSVLEYENLQKPLSEGYSLRGLVKKLKDDPMHLTCLTADDLTNLVLDYAPDVPDVLLEYADQEDIDFAWVKKQLGKTDQITFEQTLSEYFTDEESDLESESELSC